MFRALEDPSGCDMEAGCEATGRKERDPGGWCSLSSQGPVAGGRNAGLTGVQTHSSLLGMDRGPAHSWLLMKARSRWKPPKMLTGQSEAERVLIACDQSRAAAVAQPHSALPFAGMAAQGQPLAPPETTPFVGGVWARPWPRRFRSGASPPLQEGAVGRGRREVKEGFGQD